MQLNAPSSPVLSNLAQDKVVVVTGGAGLLGRAFCRALAEHGGIPVIADIDMDRGRLALTEIQNINPNAALVPIDIGNLESVQDALRSVKQRFGRIDVLLNNAYPRNERYGCRFEDIRYEDFCDNISLHAGGYFLAAQQAVAIFREQGHGHIINMGSVYGSVAPRFDIYDGTAMTMPAEYAVIKAGVVHLTRYLAKYLRGEGIRVNSISPGGIRDNQPESFQKSYRQLCSSKGLLEAEDVCGTLLFLVSDLSKYINGQNLVVDDGFSL